MDGDVDWPAVMRELRAIGYDDFVISEVGGDRETYAETRRRMEKILVL
jgi:sugar phosphate isomerase/epimerase